jgi:small-conductance mechanosensitive channel
MEIFYNLDNEIQIWLQAIFVFFLIFVALYLFRTIVLSRLRDLCMKTKIQADEILLDSIIQISPIFYFMVSVWAAIQFLELPDLVVKIINWVTLILLVYYATQTIQKLSEYIINHHVFKERTGESNSGVIVKGFITQLTKVIIWGAAILILLQNLGVQISVLLGGMGLAGLAVGFALQSVLEDIFAFFSIYFDRPFEIGDFVVLEEEKGVIEKIGIKSTRIRTLQGQELVVSNRELTSKRIHNYRKMQERRIVFSFGITYETDYKKLKKVNKIVKNIFNNIKRARLDRIHFHEFGDFSLNYEVVYYVLSQDYYEYMDTQEIINLALFQEFEREGISFAYPTKRVILDKN